MKRILTQKEEDDLLYNNRDLTDCEKLRAVEQFIMKKVVPKEEVEKIKKAFANHHSILRTYENKRNTIRKTFRKEKEAWTRKKKEFEEQLTQKDKEIEELKKNDKQSWKR